jgi:hypothetical protein
MMMCRSWIPRAKLLWLPAVAILGNGCAGTRLAPPSGELAADPAALAADLRASTLPATPMQLNFNWTLDEQGSRVRGNGVVRTESQRIRLDLFGPRGDTYLVAALVGSEYRLPPQVTETVKLPSAVLLWGALGILEPPENATLESASTTADGAELRYQTPDDHQFAFTFQLASEPGAYRLVRVQHALRQGVLETVTLERSPDRGLSRVHYRDWVEFRDLTLDLESIRAADPFPPSIWSPDAAAR